MENQEIVYISSDKLKGLLLTDILDINLIKYNNNEFIYVKENDFYVNKKYYLTFLEYRKFNRMSHFEQFSKEINNSNIGYLKRIVK